MQIDYDRAKKINGYMEKMQKENELRSKDGIWKWNEIGLAAMYVEDAVRTNGDRADVVQTKAYWLALRLKFTTDEITTLIQDYLAGKKDYNYQLYDKTIFGWMKYYGIPYPEAILYAYLDSANKAEVNEYGDYYPTSIGRNGKLRYSNLLEDGETIEYYEYKGIYGDLSEEEKIQRKKESKRRILKIADAKIRKSAEQNNMTYEEYVKWVYGDVLDD